MSFNFTSVSCYLVSFNERCFIELLLISAAASPSLILSKSDGKTPFLLVKALIFVYICHTCLLCSKSEEPVVTNVASLKQNAKLLFTNLSTSSTAGSKLEILPSALHTVISNSR